MVSTYFLQRQMIKQNNTNFISNYSANMTHLLYDSCKSVMIYESCDPWTTNIIYIFTGKCIITN